MRTAAGSLLRSYKQPNIYLNLDGRGLLLVGALGFCRHFGMDCALGWGDDLGRGCYLSEERFYGREVVFGYVGFVCLEVVPGPPLDHSYEA